MENPEAASAADVIALQQRYGNRAVRRMLQRDESDAPTTTAPRVETARDLFKRLSLLYHPDKAPNQEDLTWYNQMMGKILSARNDLAALKRLEAEGAAHTSGVPTTTAPTTQPSGTELSTELSPQAPMSQELVQNAAPLAIELSSPTTEEPSEEPGSGPQPSSPEEEEPRRERPVFEAGLLRMQTLGHNRKVLPVLKKYMAERNASGSFNFYFDASTNNRDLYRKYFQDGVAQPVQLPERVKTNLDALAQSKDWSGMALWMNQARIANQEFINTDILPVFELTPEYQKFKVTSRDRPVLSRLAGVVGGAARGVARGQAGRQLAVTRRTVMTLDMAIDRATRSFDQGKAMLERKSSPEYRDRLELLGRRLSTVEEDAAEKQRMLKQAQLRYAGVIRAFSRQYVADKTFRKERYGAFFARLQRFNRKWVEYKAYLGQ